MLVLFVGVAAWGCADAGTSASGGVTHACAPGKQIACACVDAPDGVQICSANGSVYGACQCGGTTGAQGGNSAAGTSGSVGATTAGAGGAGNPPCEDGLEECDGQCVDIASDPDNCNGCGLSCGPERDVSAGTVVCCTGVCTNLNANAENCGACDNACESDTCASGTCAVALASGLPTLSGNRQHIAVDATSVYWVTHGDDITDIMKVPKGGGSPVTIVSEPCGALCILDMAVGATSVYWTNITTSSVRKAPLGGGAPVTIASGQSNVHYLAVDATSAYWTDYDGNVKKVPLGGGIPVTLASNQGTLQDIAVDSTSVYWTELTANPAGDVVKLAVGGGTASALASGYPNQLAVDAANVYWTDYFGIMKVPAGGGSPVTLDSAMGGTIYIAVGATSAYWLAPGSSSNIKKVGLGGGATDLLVSSNGYVTGLTANGTSVYWSYTDVGGCAIMRVDQ